MNLLKNILYSDNEYFDVAIQNKDQELPKEFWQKMDKALPSKNKAIDIARSQYALNCIIIHNLVMGSQNRKI